MRTINQILNEEIQQDDEKNSPRKIITCGRCGQDYLVPGYVMDYNCQCKKKTTDVDATKLADRMANLQTDYILKNEARDFVIQATANNRQVATNKINR